MYRYLALIWNASDPDRAAEAARLIGALRGRGPEWTWVNETRAPVGEECGSGMPAPRAAERAGLALFHAAAREGVSGTDLLPAGGGAVFGTLFRTGSAGPRATLDERDRRAILASGGAALLERHWGRYVAIVRTPRGSVVILRDPAGALPCLLARHRGVWIACSELEDALALGLELSINWRYVAALLADFGLQSRETGLEPLTEVQPGESVELTGERLARTQLWQPLHLARSDPIHDPEKAATALREAVRQCVHAWAACHPRILHRLSGGLDSAIVLAALREAPAGSRVTCVNYFGEGPQEDERAFARRAAARARCPLIEQPHEPGRVRLEAALAVARTARPYFYLYSIEHGRFEAQLAASLGASALFSGVGGDGLFHREGAALAATDALYLHGFGRRLFRAAIDAAIIERTSLWPVLGAALRRRMSVMAMPSRTAGDSCSVHPWLAGAPQAPPGKVLQVRTIGTPLPCCDPLGRPDDPQIVHPLLSQPVIEVCLRIPTPTLVSGGWDRAIARRAFVHDIPPQIARRRAKGASTASAQRIFESNLPFLRDLLLGGLLVKQGLLDRRELERTLAPGASLRDSGFVPVLFQDLSTEVWLRRWTA